MGGRMKPTNKELAALLRRAADKDTANTTQGVARRAEYRAAANALEAATAKSWDARLDAACSAYFASQQQGNALENRMIAALRAAFPEYAP